MCMDGSTFRWMNEWTDGWTNGWVVGMLCYGWCSYVRAVERAHIAKWIVEVAAKRRAREDKWAANHLITDGQWWSVMVGVVVSYNLHLCSGCCMYVWHACTVRIRQLSAVCAVPDGCEFSCIGCVCTYCCCSLQMYVFSNILCILSIAIIISTRLLFPSLLLMHCIAFRVFIDN